MKSTEIKRLPKYLYSTHLYLELYLHSTSTYTPQTRLYPIIVCSFQSLSIVGFIEVLVCFILYACILYKLMYM